MRRVQMVYGAQKSFSFHLEFVRFRALGRSVLKSMASNYGINFTMKECYRYEAGS